MQHSAPHIMDWFGYTLNLFCRVVCVLTTRHYVLQSVSVLDPIYMILINAHVARLSTAGAHMAYPADAALVDRHDSFFNDLIFHVLALSCMHHFYQGNGRSITL